VLRKIPEFSLFTAKISRIFRAPCKNYIISFFLHAPPLAAQKHQAVEDAVDPAIAPENKSTVDETKY
jgi:hypothetical protein